MPRATHSSIAQQAQVLALLSLQLVRPKPESQNPVQLAFSNWDIPVTKAALGWAGKTPTINQ